VKDCRAHKLLRFVQGLVIQRVTFMCVLAVPTGFEPVLIGILRGFHAPNVSVFQKQGDG
jgi:hypothetical protein